MIRLQDYDNLDNIVNKAHDRLCAFKGTTGKLFLLEISKRLNFSSVGCLKCVHISFFFCFFLSFRDHSGQKYKSDSTS